MVRSSLPDQDEVAIDVWRRMRALTHRREVIARVHVVAEQAGVTPAVAKALLSLSPDHPTPMRDIALSLRCDASYVTAVVDGMEDHDLAHRVAHPTDRRVKVVELTSEGAALADRVREALDELPDGFSALTPDELRELLRLLTKLES